MKLPFGPGKNGVLILLLLAVVITFVLAIGITGLELKPGLILGRGPAVRQEMTGGNLGELGWILDAFRIFLATSLVLFPFYLVYMLINADRRKKLLRDLFIFAMLLFFFDRLRVIANNLEGNAQEIGPGSMSPDLPQISDLPPLETFVNQPPGWISVIVTVVMAVSITGLIFAAAWFVMTRRRIDDSLAIVVAREAQDALLSIQSGNDLRTAIIQCYRAMVQAVKDDAGIQRDTAMTPKEFVAVLTNKGLPATPVRTLTRLFEDARYGNNPGGMRQQMEAVGCLEEIIAAVKKKQEQA